MCDKITNEHNEVASKHNELNDVLEQLRGRLALAFIVKNEGNWAIRMLESVMPVVGFISAIDTGSNDDTVELVINYIASSPVPYNFSVKLLDRFDAMRNEAISKIPFEFEWILMLDADEIIKENDYPLLLTLINRGDVDAWMLPRLNYEGGQSQGFFSYPDFQARLFRNTKDHSIFYTGAVHEAINGYKNLVCSPSLDSPMAESNIIHIHHMKFAWKSKDELAKREQQYCNLLNQFATERRSEARKSLIANLWYGVDPFDGFVLDVNRIDEQGWSSDHPYLTSTIDEINPRIIVEVGVWKGASTLTMAKKLREIGSEGFVIAVDTWLGAWDHWLLPEWFGSLRLEDGYPTLYRTFAANIVSNNLQDYVLPLPLDSVNAAHVLKAKGVRPHMVHIDGGHDYEAVLADLRCWWPLVEPGGYLIGDDYNTDGQTWVDVKRAFDDFFGAQGLSSLEFVNPKCRIRKPFE